MTKQLDNIIKSNKRTNLIFMINWFIFVNKRIWLYFDYDLVITIELYNQFPNFDQTI